MLANLALGVAWLLALLAGGAVLLFGELSPRLLRARAAGSGSAPGTRCGTGTSGVYPLTRKEVEVAILVAKGNTNKEIASRLFNSERTIDNHVQHIYNKLTIDSRAEIGALGPGAWIAGRASGWFAPVLPGAIGMLPASRGDQRRRSTARRPRGSEGIPLALRPNAGAPVPCQFGLPRRRAVPRPTAIRMASISASSSDSPGNPSSRSSMMPGGAIREQSSSSNASGPAPTECA